MKPNLKNKIGEEIENGRMWRAKEILQGAVGSMPYDQELYYEYGKILFQLGDYVQSGKYFLLTDSSDEEHHEAIATFLRRYSGYERFHQLPRQFKKVNPKEYPQNMLKMLSENENLNAHIAQYHGAVHHKPEHADGDTETLRAKVIFGVVAVLTGLIFFTGVVTIGKYMWNSF